MTILTWTYSSQRSYIGTLDKPTELHICNCTGDYMLNCSYISHYKNAVYRIWICVSTLFGWAQPNTIGETKAYWFSYFGLLEKMREEREESLSGPIKTRWSPQVWKQRRRKDLRELQANDRRETAHGRSTGHSYWTNNLNATKAIIFRKLSLRFTFGTIASFFIYFLQYSSVNHTST